MRNFLALFCLVATTLTAQAATIKLTCTDDEERKFKGSLYMTLENSRTPLQLWHAPESKMGLRPRYSLVKNFKPTETHKYVRSGFVYTADLLLSGKQTPVELTGSGRGDTMLTVKISEDEAYYLYCSEKY